MSTSAASSASGPTPGRTGKTTGSCSPPGAAPRWSPTTCGAAGRYPHCGGLGASVRFHDLRHTCVTLLLDLGVPPHVVREIVGHSAIEVTMTIYAHVSLDEKRKALGKLGEALS